MLKRLTVIVFLMLTIFLLAACGGGEAIPATDAGGPADVALPPTPTELSQNPESEPAPEPTKTKMVVDGPQMECTLVSSEPDVPAELVAIFGVTEDDWVRGPETAAVTFVEYSDFQ
jgi:hypothetical protein